MGAGVGRSSRSRVPDQEQRDKERDQHLTAGHAPMKRHDGRRSVAENLLHAHGSTSTIGTAGGAAGASAVSGPQAPTGGKLDRRDIGLHRDRLGQRRRGFQARREGGRGRLPNQGGQRDIHGDRLPRSWSSYAEPTSTEAIARASRGQAGGALQAGAAPAGRWPQRRSPQPVTGAQQQVGERIAHGCDCLARKAHSGEHGERRGERRIRLRGGRRVARQAQLRGLAISSEGATTEREQTECGDRGKTPGGKTHRAKRIMQSS